MKPRRQEVVGIEHYEEEKRRAVRYWAQRIEESNRRDEALRWTTIKEEMERCRRER